MPSAAPPLTPAADRRLAAFGRRIHARRKALKVSATTAAEAAGMSRMTLHRIERGEPSVTMGAYMNAIAALGLDVDVVPSTQSAQPAPIPGGVRIADYPNCADSPGSWHRAPNSRPKRRGPPTNATGAMSMHRCSMRESGDCSMNWHAH
ncbi:transcriptional regulator with XRE-family HTH domain [Variovorax paradoxus]|uniref:helix-turn-helix domain-containing protein n=1 Tax=Variovorax paradoxus TaxID=34073 RepID=UPI002789A996|nr:helix-turn-helix transcriptional regulator [Variovorax paradoxus]MDP9964380.1 transcriptional regulator with XRE-family HTH domain [Variovorax paradoxus]